MKRAKVSELKARLSAYLAQVRNGDTVIVCDRVTPIAQLVQIGQSAENLIIREASRPIAELFKVRAVRMRKKVNVDRLLRETRGPQ